MNESSLNVHQLVVDDTHHILITFNVYLALGLLYVVVEVNAGFSEVVDSLLKIL